MDLHVKQRQFIQSPPKRTATNGSATTVRGAQSAHLLHAMPMRPVLRPQAAPARSVVRKIFSGKFFSGGKKNLVPKRGLEPPHPCEYMDLNHARLPIPPLRHVLETEGFSVWQQLRVSQMRRALSNAHRIWVIRITPASRPARSPCCWRRASRSGSPSWHCPPPCQRLPGSRPEPRPSSSV